MATMNVSLSKEFADFVEAQVSSGGYASASEVVRDGLRLLRREQAVQDEKIAISQGNRHRRRCTSDGAAPSLDTGYPMTALRPWTFTEVVFIRAL